MIDKEIDNRIKDVEDNLDKVMIENLEMEKRIDKIEGCLEDE